MFRPLLLVAACCVALALCRPEPAPEPQNAGASGCPSACPANYQPVCGRNSRGGTKQFSNSCQLTVHNCRNPNDVYGPC